MNDARLDQSNRFVFAAYQQQRPFASFLPGIAGPLGIPLWVFYVNRGQAIASFGIESKDAPILEFQPANKAYQLAPYTGFRTFIKASRGADTRFYEPFSAWDREVSTVQRMSIGANELEIEEISPASGLKTTVLYYTLPGESIAGLVRRVTVQNLGEAPVSLEILDGLPAILPFGVTNGLVKDMGRTLEAWMEVYNLAEDVPFYRLRASVIDRPEVETFAAGHFALALVDESGMRQLLPALVDPVAVFAADTGFFRPAGFQDQPLNTLLSSSQVTCGRTPCGFFAHQTQLAPSAVMVIDSLYGHAGSLEFLQRLLPHFTHAGYFEGKYREAVQLASDLTGTVATRTSDSLFDAYCRQNFLDNVLRGGWPVLLGEGKNRKVYPIYSRKHGDLERDYNAFFVAPEPYSQGEGSYRDVNQNRRDTVRLKPEIGDFDIRTFMSLIQIDGYNPRTVKGSTFTLPPEKQEKLLSGLKKPGRPGRLLSGPFTPGQVFKLLVEAAVDFPAGQTPEVFLSAVIGAADQHIEAAFFEGYWIDHWEYNLDLIESFLAVYPDRQDELLFGRPDLPFFDSPAFVRPRSQKYVLAGGGPRQIGSLAEDPEKAALIAARIEQPNWLRTQHGHGEIYKATLFAKLVLTALLKFATLDPWGMGIEMEAGRPGWYDALNGLPALFGSGLSETYELQRWLAFLRASIRAQGGGEIRLPVEAADLLEAVSRHLAVYPLMDEAERDFYYWDRVSTARETYRERTRLGIDGAEQVISLPELDTALTAFERKVAAGIGRALDLGGGLPPTYFTFTVDEYDALPGSDPQGRPFIRPRRFTAAALPPFLEGPVHAYKSLPDEESAQKLYRLVKDSDLFDRKLKMYRVNASLEDLPHDIGRARAFPPGWLENGSIWLHMEYKYLLEILKAGLYEEFFEDFREALVPFLDPQVYGRSSLENSSFLVSSAHPDASLHGAGFVARLTGSTAEFLSMWTVMMAGRRPFEISSGQLRLALRPILPGWLFDAAGELSFRFLGSCPVTYHNPQRLDTYLPGFIPRRCELYGPQGDLIQAVPDSTIGEPYSAWVRSGKIGRIEVFF